MVIQFIHFVVLILGIPEVNITLDSTKTAFEARAIAQETVTKAARNHFIEAFAPHSANGVIPSEWRISFWDPVNQKVNIVIVKGSQTVDLSDNYEGYFMHDESFNEFSTKDVIDPIYLQIDSNQALQIAHNLDEIKMLSITSIEYKLQKDSESVLPVWILTFFSKYNGVELESARVELSADSGEILHVDLNER